MVGNVVYFLGSGAAVSLKVLYRVLKAVLRFYSRADLLA